MAFIKNLYRAVYGEEIPPTEAKELLKIIRKLEKIAEKDKELYSVVGETELLKMMDEEKLNSFDELIAIKENELVELFYPNKTARLMFLKINPDYLNTISQFRLDDELLLFAIQYILEEM